MTVIELISILNNCDPNSRVIILHPLKDDLADDLFVKYYKDKDGSDVMIGCREESEKYEEIANYPDFSVEEID